MRRSGGRMHKMQTERRLKYEHVRHSRGSPRQLRKATDPVQFVKWVRRGMKFILCSCRVVLYLGRNQTQTHKEKTWKAKISPFQLASCLSKEVTACPAPVGPCVLECGRERWNLLPWNWGRRSELKGQEEKGTSQHGDSCCDSPVCSWCAEEQKQPNNEEQTVPMSDGKCMKSHERVCAF